MHLTDYVPADSRYARNTKRSGILSLMNIRKALLPLSDSHDKQNSRKNDYDIAKIGGERLN